jgi:hypothetical protein
MVSASSRLVEVLDVLFKHAFARRLLEQGFHKTSAQTRTSAPLGGAQPARGA